MFLFCEGAERMRLVQKNKNGAVNPIFVLNNSVLLFLFFHFLFLFFICSFFPSVSKQRSCCFVISLSLSLFFSFSFSFSLDCSRGTYWKRKKRKRKTKQKTLRNQTIIPTQPKKLKITCLYFLHLVINSLKKNIKRK